MLSLPEALIYEEGRILYSKRELGDTVTLMIRPKKRDSPLLKARPGQFNMVYAYGVGEVPISYSEISDTVIGHTIRKAGMVTRVLTSLKEGDILGLRGPFGTSWPVDRAWRRNLLIVAGGIGLAPLRPVIKQAVDQRRKFRSVTVLYGARNPSSLLYMDEFDKWKEKVDLRVTVDRADEGWKGHVGVVTTLFKGLEIEPDETVAMVCGPEIMMRFTVLELVKKKVPEENIYLSFERNMKCGMGFCGHCQMGPFFICRDGPVFGYNQVKPYFGRGEI